MTRVIGVGMVRTSRLWPCRCCLSVYGKACRGRSPGGGGGMDLRPTLHSWAPAVSLLRRGEVRLASALWAELSPATCAAIQIALDWHCCFSLTVCLCSSPDLGNESRPALLLVKYLLVMHYAVRSIAMQTPACLAPDTCFVRCRYLLNHTPTTPLFLSSGLLLCFQRGSL